MLMTRWLGLCGVVVMLVAFPLPSAAQGEGTPTDSDIRFAVEDAMLFDAGVPSNQIDVQVNQGTTTLTGSVDNIRAKDRAVRIAETVKGVRAIIDRIEVKPPSRPDEEIRKDVVDALLFDPATDSYEIDAAVSGGVITLTGTVNSWQEKQLAIEVAKGVRGAQAVTDEMAISYESERTDAEILPEVKRALDVDPLVDAALLDVSVKNGTVALSGTAGSAAEKARARALAWVGGVKAVDATGLSVEPWAARPDRDFGPQVRSDEAVKNAVQDALLYDPRVKSFNPIVSVSNGVVTLSGTVDNLKARMAAERDARNTIGVWRVKNYLKVRPPVTSSDSTIVQNVNAALGFNPITDRGEITVTAVGGFVTLTGTVDSYMEKAEAEDVAMRTNGVVGVTNGLAVRNPSLTYYAWGDTPFYEPDYSTVPSWYRSDAEIKDEIEDEFFWSPFVDGDDVEVSVTGGVATLTGTVGTWFEYRSAAENAREGGAVGVINNLIVQ